MHENISKDMRLVSTGVAYFNSPRSPNMPWTALWEVQPLMMQDNAPCHESQTGLLNMTMSSLYWKSQSSDLNHTDRYAANISAAVTPNMDQNL